MKASEKKQSKPSLGRWRAAVALWLLAWVLLVIVTLMSGFGALFAAMIAFGLGRHGGPNDWNRQAGDARSWSQRNGRATAVGEPEASRPRPGAALRGVGRFVAVVPLLAAVLAGCDNDTTPAAASDCEPVPDAGEPSVCVWKVEGTRAWVYVSGMEPGTTVRVGTADGYLQGTVSDDGTFGGDGPRAVDSNRPVSRYTATGTAKSGDRVVVPVESAAG